MFQSIEYALSVRVFALVAAAALLGGCALEAPAIKSRRGDVTGRAFEFQGGVDGEWNVRFRGDSFWCAFDQQGKVRDYGSVKLTDAETVRLWDLVDAAELERRKSSRRKATDEDEPLYMFWSAPQEAGLRDVKPTMVEIWADDVYEDRDLTRLVRYMKKMIQKYHKRRPVL